MWRRDTSLQPTQSIPDSKEVKLRRGEKENRYRGEFPWGELGLQCKVGICLFPKTWKFNLESKCLHSQTSLNHPYYSSGSFRVREHTYITICLFTVPLLQDQCPLLTFPMGALTPLLLLFSMDNRIMEGAVFTQQLTGRLGKRGPKQHSRPCLSAFSLRAENADTATTI